MNAMTKKSPEERETLEILADKKLMKSLRKAEEDVRRKRLIGSEAVWSSKHSR
jgi:hypothetical protein